MNDGCGTRVVIPADAKRVADLEVQVADLTAKYKACAEIAAEAMIILAKHSRNGFRDLNRWIEKMEAKNASNQSAG